MEPYQWRRLEHLLREYVATWCKLTGAGPYRVIVAGEDGTEYTIAARRLNQPFGCPQVVDVASGIAPLMLTLSESTEAGCVVFAGGAGDRLNLDAVNPDLNGVSYVVDVFSSTGDHLCDQYSRHDCTLTTSGLATAVVSLGNSIPGRARFSAACLNPACGPIRSHWSV